MIEDGQIINRGLTQPPGQPGGASGPDIGIASHVAQVADFVAAIEQHREPSVTAQDGRAALEVVLAVYESAREHRTVKLPLAAT